MFCLWGVKVTGQHLQFYAFTLEVDLIKLHTIIYAEMLIARDMTVIKNTLVVLLENLLTNLKIKIKCFSKILQL